MAGATSAPSQITVQSDSTGTPVNTLQTVGQTTAAFSHPVVIATDQSVVSVSLASAPLPTGAATAAKQPALGTAGTPSADVLTVQGVASGKALTVATVPPATSALANVTSVTTGTASNILAANASRKRYSIFNDSTAVAYVLEGSGIASATNYSYQLAAGSYLATTDWAGAVSAAWASVNGAARVTEYTA